MINRYEPIIARNLTKMYTAEKKVLDEINLTVFEGETFGLLGSNGAGKTTLLRIFATLLHPYSGRIEIFGKDPRFDNHEIKKRIGYLPERFSFYPKYTISEIFQFFDSLHRTTKIDKEDQKEQIIKILKLDTFLDAKISTLSKGMLHKVGLGVTLLHDPLLLILDEPTSGLDPLIRTEVRKILMDITDNLRKTIIISSHILEDIEAICDRVCFLENGKLVQDPFWISELKGKLSLIKKISVRNFSNKNVQFTKSEKARFIKNSFYHIIDPYEMIFYCNIVNENNFISQITKIFGSNCRIMSRNINLEDIYYFNYNNIDWLNFIE